MATFTAFASLSAAPVLLLRRPGAEEVVQGRVAVEGIASTDLDLAASVLNAATSADVAIHLDLAVCQSAFV